MNQVLQFIDQFNGKGKWNQVIECFTCGNCYWFAHILHHRFPQSIMVYDEIENHFACEIDNEVYDITGIVTNLYNWEPWNDIKARDSLLAKHIERDCILKEKHK